MVGPGPPGPQTSVVVAHIKSQDQEQAEHADRSGDDRRQGHGAEGLGLHGGHGGDVDVLVAVVCGAAHGVDARVVLD